jgi:hypothetical protein
VTTNICQADAIADGGVSPVNGRHRLDDGLNVDDRCAAEGLKVPHADRAALDRDDPHAMQPDGVRAIRIACRTRHVEGCARRHEMADEHVTPGSIKANSAR